MTDWVAVGRVGRPHGIAGAFVVERASEAVGRFTAGARVYAGREPVTVVEAKRSGGRLVVRLDRDVARGAVLELPVSELPPAEADSFYVFRLLGLEVVDEEGRELGRIEAVDPGVANDVLRLESGIALPFVEDCVRSIDIDSGRVVVAPGFADAG